MRHWLFKQVVKVSLRLDEAWAKMFDYGEEDD